MAAYKVGYFVGSLSSTSINRLLAKALVRLAPPELTLTEIPIKDLPLYSPDFDADYPPVARTLKQSIADVDAVLFVTPEYNRSIPVVGAAARRLSSIAARHPDSAFQGPHQSSGRVGTLSLSPRPF